MGSQARVNNPLTFSFIAWTIIVMVPYLYGLPHLADFPGHPLPLNTGVPLLSWAILVASALFLIGIIVKQPFHRLLQRPGSGYVVLLPLGLYATLLILPQPVGKVWQFLLFTALWAFGARQAMRRWGAAGWIGALLFWFPGNAELPLSAWGWVLPAAATAALAMVPASPRFPTGSRAPGWLWFTLAIVAYLTCASVQRQYGPYLYLSGVTDNQAWVALYGGN